MLKLYSRCFLKYQCYFSVLGLQITQQTCLCIIRYCNLLYLVCYLNSIQFEIWSRLRSEVRDISCLLCQDPFIRCLSQSKSCANYEAMRNGERNRGVSAVSVFWGLLHTLERTQFILIWEVYSQLHVTQGQLNWGTGMVHIYLHSSWVCPVCWYFHWHSA